MNRFAVLLLLLTGCTHVAAKTPDPDKSQAAERMTFSATLSQIDVTTKDQLSAVKEQTELLRGIKSEIEKLNAEEPGDEPSEPAKEQEVIPDLTGEAGTTAKDSDEAGPPVLFISYAPFTCPPCDQLKADIEAGKFSDFQTQVATDWIPRGYPAIRWQEDGKYKSIVGYDANTLPFLKSRLLGQRNLVASQESVSQTEPVVLQRVSGPRWNWNGDWSPSPSQAASHLQQSHGIDASGMSLAEMQILHDNAHNAGRQSAQYAMPVRRVRYIQRSGGCPTCL